MLLWVGDVPAALSQRVSLGSKQKIEISAPKGSYFYLLLLISNSDQTAGGAGQQPEGLLALDFLYQKVQSLCDALP